MFTKEEYVLCALFSNSFFNSSLDLFYTKSSLRKLSCFLIHMLHVCGMCNMIHMLVIMYDKD